MDIRTYNYWSDDNINHDCCICDRYSKEFVLDFGNYKTTICKGCLEELINKAQKAQKTMFCRECKYRQVQKPYSEWFKCSCEKSKKYDCDADYLDVACECFEDKGE